ncbi:hypothetical protein JCM12298_01470 [Desulfothermus naphthae]
MNDRFFGEYLISKGIIDENTLKDLLNEQIQRNKKIGEICVEKKLLSAKDVEKIIQIQQIEDKPFCEIAKKLNLLSQKQIDEILFLQDVKHVHLGELLVEKKIISFEKLSPLLEEYLEIEHKRNNYLNEYIQSLNEKELKLIIEVVTNYFVRIRHEILKPIYVNKKIINLKLTSILKIKIYNKEKKTFHLKIFGRYDTLDDFIKVTKNYLLNKNIKCQIENVNTLEGIETENNIIFYSPGGNMVILFYQS